MIERFHVGYVHHDGSPTFGTEPLPVHTTTLDIDTEGLDDQGVIKVIGERIMHAHGGVATEAYRIDANGNEIKP